MFKSLTIRTKIVFAFVAIAVVSAVAGAFSYQQTRDTQVAIAQGIALGETAQSLTDLQSNVQAQNTSLKSFILTGDRAHLSQFQEKTKEIEAL